MLKFTALEMGAMQTKDAKLDQLKHDVYIATPHLVLSKRSELSETVRKFEACLKEAQEALDEYMLIKDHVFVNTTGTIQ